jgi:acyl phosphate:glycerol-3-phosphate acyltransferase
VLSLITIILLSYLIGSIPSSIWLGKLTKGIDIRNYGSGNPGATNTFRILGWKSGLVVSMIDMFKGFTAAHWVSQIGYTIGDIPVVYGGWETDTMLRIIAGLAAVLGHMYTLFAGFQGGKGVITAAGMLYALDPVSISISISIFLILTYTTRYVSIGSMLATASYPLINLFMRYGLDMPVDGSLLVFSSVTAIAILIRHTGNIKRLLTGTENRISSFKPAKGHLNKEPSS